MIPQNSRAKRFDYDLVECLESHVIKLTKFAKYAQFLKNSVASKRLLARGYF